MTTTTHTPTPRTDALLAELDEHFHGRAADVVDFAQDLERELTITTAALRTIAALSNAPTRHVDDYGDIARAALRDAGITESEVTP